MNINIFSDNIKLSGYRDEFQENINFSISTIINLLNNNNFNNFQKNIFKKTIESIIQNIEDTYHEDKSQIIKEIFDFLVSKIIKSEQFFYLQLLHSSLEEHLSFNPLVTPDNEFNILEMNSNNFERDFSNYFRPTIMKLLDESKKLSFILDFLILFKTNFHNMENNNKILFGKEFLSDSNILFRDKKYSMHKWWEPLHFNLYEINDFYKIDKEDFIKEQKEKYYKLYEENNGNKPDDILKMFLDFCLQDNLGNLFNEKGLGFSNTKMDEEYFNNLFIDTIIKNKQKENIPEKIIEKEDYDFTSIKEVPIPREIVMIEIFSKFNKEQIEKEKDKLIQLNLYPSKLELIQIIFLFTHNNFYGCKGRDFVLQDYFDIINKENKIKKNIISYIDEPSNNLKFAIENKLILEQDSFNLWLSNYSNNFKNQTFYLYSKNLDSIQKNYIEKLDTFLKDIINFSEKQMVNIDKDYIYNVYQNYEQNFSKFLNENNINLSSHILPAEVLFEKFLLRNSFKTENKEYKKRI